MPTKAKSTSFIYLKDKDLLAELVLVELSPPQTALLTYDRKTKLMMIEDKIEENGKTYVPSNDMVFQTEMIPLPQSASDYEESKLIKEVKDLIDKYCELEPHALQIATYYIFLTWSYDNFRAVPYLRALGDYDTGKGRFLEILSQLCYKPFFTTGATPAIIFRTIDAHRGTLIIDEADIYESGERGQEILAVLNAGYKKGVKLVRAKSDDKGMLIYEIFGPKVFAARRTFPDSALESRCLTIDTTGLTRKDIPYHLPPEFFEKAKEIRDKLLKFRFEKWGNVKIDEKRRIEGIPSRLNEIMLPLLSIFASRKARKELVSFAEKYAKQLKTLRSTEIPAQVLAILWQIFKEGGFERTTFGEILIPFKRIVEEFNVDRKKEQGDYLLSPHKLGRILASELKFETRRATPYNTFLVFEEEQAKKRSIFYHLDLEELLK